MRLINTTTYEIREFYDVDKDFPYAVLSHTWEQSQDDPLRRELTCQDMRDITEARRISGWTKVERLCDLAAHWNPPIEWAWIDTCCIDKTSSAELTEAINSMFRWYRYSTVCFVYLKDLQISTTQDFNSNRYREDLGQSLKRCLWFERGWTLQELIAPRLVEFYDQTWIKRGTKDFLKQAIRDRTGIDLVVLDHCDALPTIPVGRRLSWAANRRTTRVEDMAYSLFGIFGVNMPLIYGEGELAFLRLQSEIAQHTSDLSLFAWDREVQENDTQQTQMYAGIFAPSPQLFKSCNDLIALEDPAITESYSFRATNQGLEFQATLGENRDKGSYLMNLFCYNGQHRWSDGQPRALALRLVKTIKGFATYYTNRLVIPTNGAPAYLWPGHLRSVKVPFYLSWRDSKVIENRFQHAFKFLIQCPPGISVLLRASLEDAKVSKNRPEQSQQWDPLNNTFISGGFNLFTGMLAIEIQKEDVDIHYTNDIRILCGFENRSSLEGGSHQSPQAGPQPWVGFLCADYESTELPNPHFTKTLWETLQRCIVNNERYESAVPLLRQNLDRAKETGCRLPESISVKGYKYQNSSYGISWENIDWYTSYYFTNRSDPTPLSRDIGNAFSRLTRICGSLSSHINHIGSKLALEQIVAEKCRLSLCLTVEDVVENGIMLFIVLIKVETIAS